MDLKSIHPSINVNCLKFTWPLLVKMRIPKYVYQAMSKHVSRGYYAIGRRAEAAISKKKSLDRNGGVLARQLFTKSSLIVTYTK